jgi:pimeloyl-ACP methyl ester carboxylesterase
MLKNTRFRCFAFLIVLNLILILACIPAGPGPSDTPTPPGPLKLPTPTPLPPTPTPTPLPMVSTGTILRDMTRKHEELSVEQIDLLLSSFLPAGNCLPARYAVDTYRIWFRTRDENNVVISVQADLRIPRTEEPESFPVFVYGSGTTGIANKCGTLNEYFAGRNWGDYRSHLTSYATQGFIVILANWQGFDDRERTHPYFVAELEGRVMLDAARAVADFFEQPPDKDILARPTDEIFLGGYSQGGHGALAASRLAPEYAPELNIKGVIGHATAPDVEGLMYDSPQYAPYIVYAYRSFYGDDLVDPKDVFLEKWLPTFESDVTSKCIDDVLEYYPSNPVQLFTPEFREALYNDQWGEPFAAFKAKLDVNDSNGKVYSGVPLIILHGEGDPIVKPHTIEKFVAYMCREGQNVTYKRYLGIHHFYTRQNSYIDTLAWMQEILNGNTPVSNCSLFVTQREDRAQVVQDVRAPD